MSNQTKLLALDTSTTASGWTLFINAQYHTSGVLLANADITNMVQEINKIIKKEKPHIVVIETPVVRRNAQTYRKLCMLYGAVFGICIANQIEFETMAPSSWRKWAIFKTEYQQVKGNKREVWKEWAIEIAKKELNRDEIDDNEAESYLLGKGYINWFLENSISY